MGTYYTHTSKTSVNVPYSFRCEQCMQDSGPLTATIVGVASTNSNFKNLNEKKQEKLREQARVNLVKAVKDAHRDAEEKHFYIDAFKDECPHCHKPQSWAIGAATKNMYSTPMVWVILGIIVGAACYFCLGIENSLTVALAVFGICVVIGLGCLIVNMSKVGKKKKITSGAAQSNIPVIQWSAVQEILNED